MRIMLPRGRSLHFNMPVVRLDEQCQQCRSSRSYSEDSIGTCEACHRRACYGCSSSWLVHGQRHWLCGDCWTANPDYYDRLMGRRFSAQHV